MTLDGEDVTKVILCASGVATSILVLDLLMSKFKPGWTICSANTPSRLAASTVFMSAQDSEKSKALAASLAAQQAAAVDDVISVPSNNTVMSTTEPPPGNITQEVLIGGNDISVTPGV